MRNITTSSFLLSLILGLVMGFGNKAVQAQQTLFADTFTVAGDLVHIDSVFNYGGGMMTLAVKVKAKSVLTSDTLFLILRDIDGIQGRYYMKRSKNQLEANTLIQVKRDGIYRAYIYDPKSLSQPLSVGRLYITSAAVPTRAALIQRQMKLLADKGLIKQPAPVVATTNVVKPAPTPTPVKPAPEPVKPAPEPVKPAPEPVKPAPEPVKPAPEPVKPAPEPVKPAPEPVKPAPEPVKPAPEPVKPAPEPVKPAPEPVKPAPEPVKPAPEPVQTAEIDIFGTDDPFGGGMPNLAADPAFSDLTLDNPFDSSANPFGDASSFDGFSFDLGGGDDPNSIFGGEFQSFDALDDGLGFDITKF